MTGSRTQRMVRWLFALLLRLTVLLLPTFILLAASLREPAFGNLMLWTGTVFQAAVCFLSFMSRGGWQQPLGPSVITLYLIALTWLWFAKPVDDWYTSLSKGLLLVTPLVVFGFQTLNETGAPRLRRANLLARRLADRKDWPGDLAACLTLPEVKALRAALGPDAAPALALLRDPRPEVRVAALAALEFRKDWRPGQAELVLQVAQSAEQPLIRAAAVTALGNLDDRVLVELLAQFLHDTSREVRRAAAEALLWDTDRRWSWIRFAVRRVLADPLFFNDGPLLADGQALCDEAVKDLTAWCAEKGHLAARAAQTLAAHYHRRLSDNLDQKTIAALRAQLADPHTPSGLRLELGKLLQHFQELDAPLLERLLEPSNPATLRLIACETLLTEQTDELLHNRAVSALRDLARLPNREIALATANVVQRRLGVDLGLGLGLPLPPVHSRQAAEITRRVLQWSMQNDEEDLEASSPQPVRL
ncbi:MAG: HEAT repeat domain-containing protein [Gemmataceae bacterium]|nr:HEAT repeat domain-containing protein [Gemmataceae bacterium]